jgi:hypothetical protein
MALCLLYSHLSPSKALKPYVPATALCPPLRYSVPSMALCPVPSMVLASPAELRTTELQRTQFSTTELQMTEHRKTQLRIGLNFE